MHWTAGFVIVLETIFPGLSATCACATLAWPSGQGGAGDHWIVSRVPVDLTDQRDSLQGYTIKSWPSPGEVIARMITWLPGFEYPMHRSDTLDIFFVIAGQIELLLDEGSTVVHAGDTVIQCGTNHGWRVIGNEPCTVAGVLIDAAPLSPGATASP